jgi:hypothetical protein
VISVVLSVCDPCSQYCESGFSLRHVCLSVRIAKLGSHWTDFHWFWCLSNLRKSVGKIQVSLKSDRNNISLHDNFPLMKTSPSALLRMRNISDKSHSINHGKILALASENSPAKQYWTTFFKYTSPHFCGGLDWHVGPSSAWFPRQEISSDPRSV